MTLITGTTDRMCDFIFSSGFKCIAQISYNSPKTSMLLTGASCLSFASGSLPSTIDSTGSLRPGRHLQYCLFIDLLLTKSLRIFYSCDPIENCNQASFMHQKEYGRLPHLTETSLCCTKVCGFHIMKQDFAHAKILYVICITLDSGSNAHTGCSWTIVQCCSLH